MTTDDILRMAREVGIEFDPRWGTCLTGNIQLERFFRLAYAAGAAAEREECAKVCDTTPPQPFRPSIEAAHAIRARGKT